MSELKKVFNKLFAHFGPQGWWPTTRQDKTSPEYIGGPNTEKEKFEVMIGAVLTQNTSWSNVEKAMINLIKKDLINPKRIIDTKDEELAELIKPSGYFNQKTKKIKNLAKFIIENPIKKLEKIETKKLRDVLLSINGVGEETADSIILYALNKPI
ncbi:endonuclease III domain-containing protein, partial [Candidatus Woesearchaeota archaeon]|nr:endonuclease III domain-containing protein [Candidatus Woesearchaeota archaeon]